MDAINERVAQIVKNSGLTKTSFAEKINVSQGFVSQLCSGLSTPSDRTISDICREFNVNEDWLRTGEGEPYRQFSRKDAIAAYLGKISGGKVSPLEETLIEFMSLTSVEEWEELSKILKRFANSFADKKKEDAQD